MSDDLASHLPAQSALVHFEAYAKIEDERTKALTTPKANVFQRRMYETYETLLAIMLAVDWAFEIRILGLKIRQCGGTTCSNHIIYHHSQRFATDSVIMTNVNTNSKEVLRRMKTLAQNDAFPWNNPIDPLATNLSWPNGSRADITSAETTNVGISRTRQAALFSECAKYPRGGVKDDKAIMASVLPSLNQLGIAESTPEGACYDPKTEVLTDEGWKFFADLRGTEGIMTRPQAGGPVYYQHTWTKQVHHHKGEMIQLKNSRSVDLLVTPNHSVWCASLQGKMKMRRAETLAPCADYVFERSLEWDQPEMESFDLPSVTFGKGNGFQTLPEIAIPLNVWLPFLGHWLADGGVICRQRNSPSKLRRNTVYVTQTQAIESFRASAMALAPFIRGKVKEIKHGQGRRWIIDDTQLARYLNDYSQPKRIPRSLLLGMSKSQCQILLDAIYEGDGDNNRRNGKRRFDCGKVYVGIDKTLQDDVMELCLKAGYAVSANGKPRNMRACFRRCHRAYLKSTTGPKRITGYNGLVYCVSLPKDHLLMVRRGGHALWCGNSGWMYEQWWGTKDMPGAMNLQDFLAEMKRGNKKPGNGWVKVFAAWFEFEENQRHISDHERETIMRTLTNREVNGINTYHWTAEQIAWRRDKLYSECGGSEELFDEYYPEDEISCIDGSVRVPTERGLIPISEIVTGDVSNGRVVSATRCNGIRETIVVTTQQGFSVVCTPEHRIALENGEWSRADGTLGRAIRLVPPMFATHPHIVRWDSFGGVQSSLEISEDWGLWLGIYMGDGSFYKNQMSISCDAKDRDSVAKITRLSRRLFGNIFRLRRPKHAKGIELRSYAPAYKQLFQALDLVKPCYHGLKRKIHVPECIWRSPKEVVRQFVRGLFETDGWISATGRTAQLFAKDPEFLRQVQQLLLGFGIQSSLTHRIAKVKGNLYKGGQLYIYNSQIDTFIEEIGFLSARKQTRCQLGYKKLPKSGRKRRIIQGVDIVASIASGEKAKVYDLEIQGEPVFAAGGIKVHNCFLSSGRPRFNMGAVVRMERKLHLYPLETGTLNPNPGGMVFIPDTSGFAPIHIWERPRPGCKYLVWCDPATGEDQTESANPDRHSIGVLRAGYLEAGVWHKPKVVARVRPPFTGEGDVVIEHIARLSEFYGKCLVVLEINMGLHILKGLKDLGVPLFKREVIDPKDREKTLLMYGWKLKDRDQRREVVVCLASHIRDEAIEIPCPHIIGEAKTFVIDKNGKEIARAGCKDDDILGLAMGLTCIGAATTYHGPHRVKRAPADRHKWRRHPSYNYPRE